MNEKEMLERKNSLLTRAEDVLNKAKAESRELTDAEMAELAEIRDNVRKIVKAMGLQSDIEELANGSRQPVQENDAEAERALNDEQIFNDFLRGYNERTGEMTKAANGAIIPTTIANRIIKKVYDISPILRRSTRYNVKGNLDLPYYDTTSTTITVGYKAEFSPLTSSSGTFASITLTGFLAGALTKISRSLINNAQFDVVGFVVDEMAYQIARFIEGELLHGTTDYVTGLSTLTNTLTAASANAITADEVVQLKDKIKDVYQNNAVWIMSPATRTALRLLKDDMGRYLLQDDISSPFGNTLLGKPVYVSDNMPEIATKNTVIYYGDMRGLATKFSEDINVEVLREKYADEHAVGVISWFEFDAKVEDAQKIAKLVMA